MQILSTPATRYASVNLVQRGEGQKYKYLTWPLCGFSHARIQGRPHLRNLLLSTYTYIHPSFLFLSTCLSIFLLISANTSIFPSIYLSMLNFNLFSYLSTCPSISNLHRFILLSINASLFSNLSVHRFE